MYYKVNLKNKILINQTLFDTLFKHKCKNKKKFLHLAKIMIRSSLLYYLFSCLYARNFFIVENSLQRENCKCYGLLRISASRRV